MLHSIVASFFDNTASAAFSRSFSCSFAPGTLSIFASTFSTDPNSAISFVAVFSPTPGTPGMLSDVSPIRPFRSTTCSGVTPYWAYSASWSNSAISEIPLRVSITFVAGPISCSASRSPVTMMTSWPAFAARQASVPMISSASKPASSSTAIPIAASSSRTSGNCSASSVGVALRWALYPAYCSLRNVTRPLSKATATVSGFTSASSFTSIVVKPYAAFVYCPAAVASSGSA